MFQRKLLPPFQGRTTNIVKRNDERYREWKGKNQSFEKAIEYSGPEKGGVSLAWSTDKNRRRKDSTCKLVEGSTARPKNRRRKEPICLPTYEI
jgi:hypothetical protein